MAVEKGRFLRSKNPNWKGGRSITAHGYVLIRVGVDHHLADSRGYAYEHRIVAEQIVGRRLKDGEVVHHKNGDRSDNDPQNIAVVGSVAEHRFEHRTPQSSLRNPGQRNNYVYCKCGCGERFKRFDSAGRRRSYISGHNMKARHGR